MVHVTYTDFYKKLKKLFIVRSELELVLDVVIIVDFADNTAVHKELQQTAAGRIS